jgi:hypothetical protein
MTAAVLAKHYPGDSLVRVPLDPSLVQLLDPAHRLQVLTKWRGLARR